MAFELVDRAAAGRIGRFATAHGTVTTPTLMPVVNPNIDLVSAREMRDLFGCEMVITNSYVLHKHDHLREQALAEGVHKVIDWDGPVMTDSGTFQMYVYGDVEVGPDEIVAFQRDIGVDVATCLDLFVTPDMTRAEAEHAVATTLERTASAARLLRGDATGAGATDPDGKTLINATVQGGLFSDLRQACAGAYRELAVEYHTIGGVVPVMERQMYPELVDIILNAQQHLRKDRPVHLFGAGHPLVFPLATALGCDLFDSSSYAKYAKDGRVMTPEGTLKSAELDDWPVASRFLDGWSPREVTKALQSKKRGLPDKESPSWAAQRALALHNLDVCFTDMRRIRQSIRDGNLWELVEQRAACHPHLAAATRRLGEPAAQAWLEEREPTSGGRALRYTGGLTHRRPVFRRIRTRLQERFTPVGETVEAEHDSPYADAGQEKREAAMHKEPRNKPFGDALGDALDPEQDHIVISSLGPVPLGLDEAYPFSQSQLPRLDGLDPEHMGWVGHAKDDFLAAHDLMPGLPGPGLPGARLDRDFLQVLRTSDWQFGAGAGLALTGAWSPGRVREALEARTVNAAAAPVPSTGHEKVRAFTGINVGGEGGGQGTVVEPAAGPTGPAAPLVPLGTTVAPGDGFRAERSRATEKLRTAHLDGEHVLSLRAGDGLWTLKTAGARILHAALPAPANRVVVHDDSVSFNREGKSVFAQFVLDVDPALRPGDECLVVDGSDNLVAVGRLTLNREETQDFQNGTAVKVREGIPASE